MTIQIFFKRQENEYILKAIAVRLQFFFILSAAQVLMVGTEAC